MQPQTETRRPDLRDLREARGMTQDDLATELGVVRAVISRIENGLRPSVPVAKRLVVLFPGTTLEEWLA